MGSSPQTLFSRLKQRQKIIASIREYLYMEDFLEVETPLLVKNTTPDVYIESIQAGNGYLITSTEYQVKRLIADGLEKVFTICKNFRAYDQGKYHNPEFTMLEWGRAHCSLEDIEEDVENFICKAFSEVYPESKFVSFNGCNIELFGDWERLTVKEAFERYLGFNELKDFSLESLCWAADSAGFVIPFEYREDLDFLISYLLDSLQSHLGKEKPVFLHEWPAYLTSSAPLKGEGTVERSELYIGGIEVANGFPFLRDSEIQRNLFEEQQSRRKKTCKPVVELDQKYIESLNSLPRGAGMALGVDRLVMILTGSVQLSEVMAFTWDDL